MQKINKFKLSLILILPFTLVHMNASGSNEKEISKELRKLLPGHKEYNTAKTSIKKLVETSKAEWLEEQELYTECGRVPDGNWEVMLRSNEILCEMYDFHSYSTEKLTELIKSNNEFIKNIRESERDSFKYNLAPRGDAVEAAKLLLEYRASQDKTSSRAGAGTE